MSEFRQSLVARGFEQISAQVDRRALGQGPALLGDVGAKARLELRRQPFGKIARHMRRRCAQISRREPRALRNRQRGRRMVFAREEPRRSVGVKSARLPQRA